MPAKRTGPSSWIFIELTREVAAGRVCRPPWGRRLRSRRSGEVVLGLEYVPDLQPRRLPGQGRNRVQAKQHPLLELPVPGQRAARLIGLVALPVRGPHVGNRTARAGLGEQGEGQIPAIPESRPAQDGGAVPLSIGASRPLFRSTIVGAEADHVHRRYCPPAGQLPVQFAQRTAVGDSETEIRPRRQTDGLPAARR
ncbi:hypothetical protein CDEF62S_02219 [Castellaniella defragrans]